MGLVIAEIPPMAVVLTDVRARTAKPRPDGKPSKVSAGSGLYLWVMPNGGKYWRFKYRYAGKEKLLALGVYPETTPAPPRFALPAQCPSMIRLKLYSVLVAQTSWRHRAAVTWAKGTQILKSSNAMFSSEMPSLFKSVRVAASIAGGPQR
jgi:hypothetical protein